MTRLQTPILLATVVAVMVPLAAFSSSTQSESGFTPLFNGKDLTGWVYGTRKGVENKSGKGYQVENGVLFTTEEDGGNLFTEKEYADFVFRFDFRLTPNANNGIGIVGVAPVRKAQQVPHDVGGAARFLDNAIHILALTRGHRIEINPDGRLRIVNRVTLQIELDL